MSHTPPHVVQGTEELLVGAIISGGKGTAEEKFAAFEKAGMAYTRSPAELGSTMMQVLKEKGLA